MDNNFERMQKIEKKLVKKVQKMYQNLRKIDDKMWNIT